MTALSDPAEALRPLSPRRKVRLAVEILGAYIRVRRSLMRTGFRTTFEEMKVEAPAAREHDRAAFVMGLRLGRAVARTLALLPTDSRCLMRSLVLTDLLVRRGIGSSLVIGVLPDPPFQAHAWVEYAGSPLLPDRAYERRVELGGAIEPQ